VIGLGNRILKIPRYIPEGMVNYNGIYYDPESLNQCLNDRIKRKDCFVYIYIPQKEREESKEGFFFNDVRDIIGLVKAYDKEYIYMVIDQSVEKYMNFKNPVAMMSVLRGNIPGHNENYYTVFDILRIEVVEEDDLDAPRLKLGGKENE
jgi:hypothetical protein